MAVSYTHLDVYKRQLQGFHIVAGHLLEECRFRAAGLMFLMVDLPEVLLPQGHPPVEMCIRDRQESQLIV